MKPKISLIIPVYNEKQSIKKFIGQLGRILNNTDFECIVVDDGSDDGTSQELKGIEDITVIRHNSNRGYGASLKTGIRNSKGKAICIIDGDHSYIPDDIFKLLPYLENNDMVIGSRPYKLFPIYQKISKYIISKLLSFVFKQDIKDINSGLRIMKTSVVKDYLPLLSEKFSFTAGITLAMLIDKKRLEYVPIQYNKRLGKTKIKAFSYTWNFIKSYIKIIYNLKFKKIYTSPNPKE